jgi:predicted kinase
MLYLVRGLPGSGKSTFAKSLPCAHIEADMYYLVDGEYKFDPSKIKDAHKWCQDITREYIMGGLDIAVSNTFTQLWEMQPYLDMAKRFQTPVKVIKCVGKWQNVHGVPEKTLQAMASRWEDYEGEEVN